MKLNVFLLIVKFLYIFLSVLKNFIHILSNFCSCYEWGYFLISFLLLTYRKASAICFLILWPAALLKSLITSKNFMVEVLRHFNIGTCHWQAGIIWLLPVCMAFIFHFFVITLATTSSTGLSKSWESTHCFLIFTFLGNSVFFSLDLMLAVLLHVWGSLQTPGPAERWDRGGTKEFDSTFGSTQLRSWCCCKLQASDTR